MSGTMELTAMTRLGHREAHDIIEYSREFLPIYCRAFRILWQRIQHLGMNVVVADKSKLNTEIQKEFGFSKRTANSLINHVCGRYRSAEGLTESQVASLGIKISEKEIKVKKAVERVDKLLPKVAANQATAKELRKYRKDKGFIFFERMKINRMRNRLARYKNQLAEGRFPICFGSKKLFRAQYNLKETNFRNHRQWLKAFRRARDGNIFYLGSADETACNQEFQLTAEGDGWFSVKIRASGSTRWKEKYVVGRIKIPYEYMAKAIEGNLAKDKPMTRTQLRDLPQEDIFENMGRIEADSRTPISYKIVVRGKKMYLAVTQKFINTTNFSDDRSLDYAVTTKRFGVVGLDFNADHIQLAETDEFGNLVRLKKYKLPRSGDAGKNDLRQSVSEIIKYCVKFGKSLAYEKLDFGRKKSKTQKAKSSKGKDYNRMLHTLKYSQFSTAIGSSAFRNHVNLIPVNPAYTTKIAKQKYCYQRKLVTHEGAAFVIARRAQGYGDTYMDSNISTKKSSPSNKPKRTKNVA